MLYAALVMKSFCVCKRIHGHLFTSTLASDMGYFTTVVAKHLTPIQHFLCVGGVVEYEYDIP